MCKKPKRQGKRGPIRDDDQAPGLRLRALGNHEAGVLLDAVEGMGPELHCTYVRLGEFAVGDTGGDELTPGNDG